LEAASASLAINRPPLLLLVHDLALTAEHAEQNNAQWPGKTWKHGKFKTDGREMQSNDTSRVQMEVRGIL
jgi:hypothetical protein